MSIPRCAQRWPAATSLRPQTVYQPTAVKNYREAVPGRRPVIITSPYEVRERSERGRLRPQWEICDFPRPPKTPRRLKGCERSERGR